MVTCSKCGKENQNDAAFCVDCGTSIQAEISTRRKEYREKRRDDECFGLPRGGAIFGIVIGLIIIFSGLQQVFGWNIDVGPLAIVIFGLLIVAGAIYGLSRRRS